MRTRITELLGIEYPIIQGGMAWVAEYHLAAAVSNAGGLGLIGTASAPAEWVREQIREAKKLTDKPFGINIMMISPYADEVAKVAVEEGVAVITTGAGSPEKYIKMWKEAGIKVIPVVASVAMAKRMQRCGADALVAEGTEAGGHIGENTTMVLVPHFQLHSLLMDFSVLMRQYYLPKILSQLQHRLTLHRQSFPIRIHRLHHLMHLRQSPLLLHL